MIQATVKGFITRAGFIKKNANRKDRAVLRI